MVETFRESMGWLHTWAGIVLGTLLFAIFWMGTLAVFAQEIDRWMLPETRLASDTSVSLDLVLPTARELAPPQSLWQFRLPTDRDPVIRFFFRDESGVFDFRDFDPATGELLMGNGSLAGTGFIEPFHYTLHVKWKDVGYWLVGLASMAMLIMLTSGVIIHRKLTSVRQIYAKNVASI